MEKIEAKNLMRFFSMQNMQIPVRCILVESPKLEQDLFWDIILQQQARLIVSVDGYVCFFNYIVNYTKLLS